MKRVLCGLTCLLSLFGVVHAEDRADIPVSHSDQFLIGLGQGDLTKGRLVCERVAELAARADLAKQIRVQVKENIHDRVRERTGRSVEHDLVSVTVTGAVAARTAAWGTALLCLGPAQAFDTADREQIAAIFILKTPAGFEVRQSKAFGDSWGQADGSSLTH